MGLPSAPIARVQLCVYTTLVLFPQPLTLSFAPVFCTLLWDRKQKRQHAVFHIKICMACKIISKHFYSSIRKRYKPLFNFSPYPTQLFIFQRLDYASLISRVTIIQVLTSTLNLNDSSEILALRISSTVKYAFAEKLPLCPTQHTSNTSRMFQSHLELML